MGLWFSDLTASQKKKAVKHVNMFSTMHSGKLIDSGNKHRLTDETVLKLDKVVD